MAAAAGPQFLCQINPRPWVRSLFLLSWAAAASALETGARYCNVDYHLQYLPLYFSRYYSLSPAQENRRQKPPFIALIQQVEIVVVILKVHRLADKHAAATTATNSTYRYSCHFTRTRRKENLRALSQSIEIIIGPKARLLLLFFQCMKLGLSWTMVQLRYLAIILAGAKCLSCW